MFEKLAQIRERYAALRKRLEDPALYADPAQAARLLREEKELQPLMEAISAWEKARDDARAAEELSHDPDGELRALAIQELSWRSAPAWAARKRPSLPPTSSGCIPCTPKKSAFPSR